MGHGTGKGADAEGTRQTAERATLILALIAHVSIESMNYYQTFKLGPETSADGACLRYLFVLLRSPSFI